MQIVVCEGFPMVRYTFVLDVLLNTAIVAAFSGDLLCGVRHKYFVYVYCTELRGTSKGT